jgi:hypothetical protein
MHAKCRTENKNNKIKYLKEEHIYMISGSLVIVEFYIKYDN